MAQLELCTNVQMRKSALTLISDRRNHSIRQENTYFGYIISAAIQVLITRRQMGRAPGERGAKQASLAGFFGFISSSCSFAALAASRSVLVKGAHPTNARFHLCGLLREK